MAIPDAYPSSPIDRAERLPKRTMEEEWNWIAQLSSPISEGFRKSIYFSMNFPRPGHVNKRGPWHQRLPREYLTRKERRRLKRIPWQATGDGRRHFMRTDVLNRIQRKRMNGEPLTVVDVQELEWLAPELLGGFLSRCKVAINFKK